MLQQAKINNDTKVIRISNSNYQKLIAQGTYGDTLDSIVSRILEQNRILVDQEFPDKRQ